MEREKQNHLSITQMNEGKRIRGKGENINFVGLASKVA